MIRIGSLIFNFNNNLSAQLFLYVFQDYAITLAKQMKPLQQARRKEIGSYLDPQLLDHMTEDQLIQLYELHRAATDSDDKGQKQ